MAKPPPRSGPPAPGRKTPGPFPKKDEKPGAKPGTGTPNFGAPPPPPTTSTKTGTPYDRFVNFWAAKGYPDLKKNAGDIKAAADAANIDPIYFAALLMHESSARYNAPDSSAGAIGIGQIMPLHVGSPTPWNKKHAVTLQDLRNPTFNLRFSAYLIAGMIGRFGYAGAYSGQDGTYNPRYSGDSRDPEGKGPFHWIDTWDPKYVVQTTSTAPPGKAGPQVPGGTAEPGQDISPFKDPYVSGVAKGNKLTTTNDPNKALTYNGLPVARSDFLQIRAKLEDWFVSYSGRRPTNAQVQQFITKGWSTYTLSNLLSKGPNFNKSPIWKQHAQEYNAAVRDVLPPNGKIPKELMRTAIVNSWSAEAVAATLRKQTTYLQSNEFKGNVATLLNVHQSIYGQATSEDSKAISEAALANWSADQYAAWLRQQPNYTTSPEYQARSVNILDQLGMLFGATPVLTPGAPPQNTARQPISRMPNDTRVPGAPQQHAPVLNLTPSFLTAKK